MSITTIFYIAVIIGIFASVGAWLNTRIILEELAMIKEKLGIKEVRQPSMFDNDLDKE